MIQLSNNLRGKKIKNKLVIKIIIKKIKDKKLPKRPDVNNKNNNNC